MPKKHFTTSLDEDLLRAVKKLSVDLNCPVNELLEEGLEYILKLHEKESYLKGVKTPKRKTNLNTVEIDDKTISRIVDSLLDKIRNYNEFSGPELRKNGTVKRKVKRLKE